MGERGEDRFRDRVDGSFCEKNVCGDAWGLGDGSSITTVVSMLFSTSGGLKLSSINSSWSSMLGGEGLTG